MKRQRSSISPATSRSPPPPWTIEKKIMANSQEPPRKANGSQAITRKTAMLTRWLHIYLSMISFAIVFFFAVTGLTLNHADKFSDRVHTVQEKGQLNASWVHTPDT